MKLVEFNWSPTNRQLRQFGGICLVVLPFLGWMGNARPLTIGVLLVVASTLALLAWGKPKLVRPIYIAITVVTAPIGMIVSELAMLLIFFGIFLPIALVFRLIRRDALQLKIDRTSKTYWQAKAATTDMSRYYRRY